MPCNSRGGPQTSSTSVPWKLLKGGENAGLPPPPIATESQSAVFQEGVFQQDCQASHSLKNTALAETEAQDAHFQSEERNAHSLHTSPDNSSDESSPVSVSLSLLAAHSQPWIMTVCRLTRLLACWHCAHLLYLAQRLASGR